MPIHSFSLSTLDRQIKSLMQPAKAAAEQQQLESRPRGSTVLMSSRTGVPNKVTAECM